jgi:hypothetical protein
LDPHEPDHREIPALRGLDLQPGFIAIGAVRSIRVLGDDALPPKLRSVFEHLLPDADQVLAVEHRTFRPVDQCFEDALALDLRRAAQVQAVEVQEIEGVEDQPVLIPAESSTWSSEKFARPSLMTTTSPSRIA